MLIPDILPPPLPGSSSDGLVGGGGKACHLSFRCFLYNLEVVCVPSPFDKAPASKGQDRFLSHHSLQEPHIGHNGSFLCLVQISRCPNVKHRHTSAKWCAGSEYRTQVASFCLHRMPRVFADSRVWRSPVQQRRSRQTAHWSCGELLYA